MSNPSKRKLFGFLCAASLGTYLEFFDIALFSFCATILARHFFPAGDPVVATIYTWGIFAVSYLMRPLGAVIFGYMADKHSGRMAMVISMAMMATATTCIGLLPGYSEIGIWAPILLLLMRIVQSIAVSPEYNLPSVFMKNNNWFAERFGLTSSISACVTGLGMMSASWLMARILLDTNIEDIAAWQWRSPFIISGVLVGTVGIFLRWNIDEKLTAPPQRSPLLAVLNLQTADFFRAAFIAGYIGCISYAIFGFLVHQLQAVRGMSPGDALQVLGSGCLLPASFSLLAGYLSDRYARNSLMLISGIIMAISGAYLFTNLATLPSNIIVMHTWIMLASLGFFAGGFPGFLAELFAQEYRYTGSFLAYNIGMSWIGGLSPLIFIASYRVNVMLPVAIIIVYSVLVLIVVSRQKQLQPNLAVGY